MKNSKITLLYLLFGIVTILLIGFILYFSLSRVMINDAIDTTENSVSQSGKYLEVYIDRVKTMSSILAKNEDIVDFFNHDWV